MDQLALPIPIVAAPTERRSRCRLRAASELHQGDEQLSLSLRPCRPRPRRHRPSNPNAAAHALALAHLDLADKIAGNFARRTTHSFDDLHQLRDHGFAIKVPPSWRDLYASGQKLLREGLPPHAVPVRLGITAERWREIQEACTITVVALQPDI